MTLDPKDSWKRDMRCVFDGYLECAAKTPEACICKRMPRDMYAEKLKRVNGESAQQLR